MFRTVVEEKIARVQPLAAKAQRLDVKVTHRAYRGGRVPDETVELTLVGKGPVVRAEAVDGDKFVALDLAVDKMSEQLRRAKEKRVDGRQHPRGAHFEKGSGALEGIDVEPASADVLHAVATGAIHDFGCHRRATVSDVSNGSDAGAHANRGAHAKVGDLHLSMPR
ncbi:MAG: ribosome-associated translation inhibitor RaiA, partial [Actinomycetota bacterium]